MGIIGQHDRSKAGSGSRYPHVVRRDRCSGTTQGYSDLPIDLSDLPIDENLLNKRMSQEPVKVRLVLPKAATQ